MARSFNGSTDKAINNSTFSLSLPPTFSMAAWVNMTNTTPAYSTVYGSDNSGGASQFCTLHVKSTGKLAYYYNSGFTGGDQWSLDPGSGTISTGTWFHFGFAVNSSISGVSYLNGASDGSLSHTAGASAPTLNEVFVGYGGPGQSGRVVTGSIADCAMWNVTLTAAEFLALSKGARPFQIRPNSLVNYFPLDGIQSPEPDLSGKANNLTLTGTALASGPPFMQFTPRWPLNAPFGVPAVSTFQPAWAMQNRIVVDGIGI